MVDASDGPSENRAVADDVRSAARRPARFARRCRRPAAQVPPSSTRAERKVVARRRRARSRTSGAIRSSSATVSARHSTTSARSTGSCALRRVRRIAQREHAGVDEQPAIAVFGQAGQAVDVGHRDARRLQRLDQRIGEPLRQLVERHQAVGRVVAPDRRMAPAVAERHAAQRQPARPDRPEMRAAALRRIAAPAAVVRRLRRQMIEQPARPRSSCMREHVRLVAHRLARAARAAPRGLRGRPADCPALTWKPLRQLVGVKPRSRAASARSGSRRIGREQRRPRTSAGRRAPALPSGRSCTPVARVAIAPVRARAGIEQHRDDGEVERRARPRRRRPAMRASPRRRPRGRARRRRNAASARGTARPASG